MTDNAKELARQIENYVNYNRSGEDFAKAFTNWGIHRTLQQKGLGLMLMVVEAMASDDYRTDGRNEDSKKVAKMLIAGFKSECTKMFIEQGESQEKAEQYAEKQLPSKWLPLI